MKNIFSFLLIILILISTSCEESSNGEKIIGKWKMIRVFELSEDVTQNHNPDNNRWIYFKEDTSVIYGGIFESGRNKTTENSGNWFYDENENELYLDSDAGEDDDSYWAVSFSADTMLWKGRRFEFNKRFEIFYKKEDQ